LKNIIPYCLFGLLVFSSTKHAFAQNLNLENAIKDFRTKVKTAKKLVVKGGLNASSTFTNSTVGSLRDPVMYTVSGNLSFTWMSISIPVNLNLTNAGFSYSYQYPRLPSRLSLHPSYKNIQAHIGDFSMSFSPYTMSGFQIVGGGLEVKDIGSWSFSGFYGQFQKAVEMMPGNGSVLAAYARNGFGLKASNNSKRLQTIVSFIRVHDKENSLRTKPDSLNIYPKANIAFSVQQRFTLMKNLKLDYEVGSSIVTNDLRPEHRSHALFQKLADRFIEVNNSTNLYKAFKTNLLYSLGSSNIGIGYERVDPGYQTLAAYYFTNDFENITATIAQQLFKNKLNLSMTLGSQRDDLRGEKTGSNHRIVMSVNGSINASKKFTTNFTYSNFQSFTNVKPQFQQLNQLTPYDNLDTLNYRQLTQNATLSCNYLITTSKDISRVINCMANVQDSYDEQAKVVSKGNASTFYNLALNYTSTKLPKAISLSAGFNLTYNTIGKTNTITAGPTMMYSRQLFTKRVRVNLTGAFNTTMQSNLPKQSVLTSRINASYTLKKKHQLGWMCTLMQRKSSQQSGRDFSTTLNYGYAF
jgi:hypothetical protein